MVQSQASRGTGQGTFLPSMRFSFWRAPTTATASKSSSLTIPTKDSSFLDSATRIAEYSSGGSGYAKPWRYLLWQTLAYESAAELHKSIGFRHRSPCQLRFRECTASGSETGGPVYMGSDWRCAAAPVAFRHYFGRSWPQEAIRSARVRLLRFWPSLRSAASASSVTLATNHETANLLRQLGAQDVRLWLDSGIPFEIVSNHRAPKSRTKELTLLWVGRMQPRKALPLALEALAAAGDMNVRLWIAGDGEMRGSWEEYAKALHLEDRVEFLGRVPWDAMSSLYQNADAFLFTSLRDSFGTQVLEAMGHGLPVLTLDHQGVGTFIPANARSNPSHNTARNCERDCRGNSVACAKPRCTRAPGRSGAGLCGNTNMGEARRMDVSTLR